MTRQRSLEQRRAEVAWQKVLAAKKRSKEFAQKYGQLARSAPADIQINGLAQTLAFWRAKGKGKQDDEHSVIFRDLSEWVIQQMGWQPQNTQADLLVRITAAEASTHDYRRATAEAIAFLQWLKRFAEAELSEQES